MYKIYAKRNDQTVCIYNDVMMTEETKALSPHLTLTESNAGELTFKLPPTNNGYGFIERLDTEIIVTKRDTEIWSGRVISSKEDFFKNVTYTCEGELAYLNDTIQPQAEFHINFNAVATFLNTLINEHNKKAKEDKRFHVGIVTVTDPNDYLYRYTNYESTMHDINDKLVDRLGGFIRLRKVNGERYIDYISTNSENGGDMRNTSNQVVQFGDNLLDFTKSFESTEFCTVVLPLGSRIEETEETQQQSETEEAVVIEEDPETGEAIPVVVEEEYHVYDEEPIVVVEELPTPTEEVQVEIIQEATEENKVSGLDKYVTIESVNNGLPYLINQESYKRFGWIEKVVNFDDVNTPNILKTKGETYLNEAQFDTMVLEVSAIDLGYLNVDVDNIHLSDKVRVVSRPHGLDRYFPITKISIPLDNPANTTFTMGTEVKVSLSSKTVTGSDAIVNKVNNMISSASTSVEIKQAVDSAKNEAAQMMNAYSTGYVTLTHGDYGTGQLYITDAPIPESYDTPANNDPPSSINSITRYWRWNSAGLSYYNKSKATAANPYGLVTAWTMDGKFNADVITTGVLRGASNKFYLDMDYGTVVMSDGIFTGSFSAAVGSTFFSANEYGVVWADTYSKKYSDGTIEMYDTDNANLLRYKWDKTGFVSYGKNYSGSKEFEVRYGFSGYFITEEASDPIVVPVEIESVGSGSSSEWISNAIAYYQNNQNEPFAIFGLTANSSALKMINDGDIYLKSKNGNINIYTSVNDFYGTIELSARGGDGRIILDGQVECGNGASGTLTDGYGTRWTFEDGILVNIDNPNNY